jgi:prepilin-type N-terminal cleavage/methylation domain-containing protein
MLKKKGFTLIELVVVMAIIAVLSLLIIAAITAARRQSVNTQRTGNAKTIEIALESFAAKNQGKYPGGTMTINQLHDLLRGTTLNGPFLNQDISLEDDNYSYVNDGTAGADASTFGLAVCSVNNSAAPTIDLSTQTVTGCTGSDVSYKTFR